jgi:hypothetical protein
LDSSIQRLSFIEKLQSNIKYFLEKNIKIISFSTKKKKYKIYGKLKKCQDIEKVYKLVKSKNKKKLFQYLQVQVSLESTLKLEWTWIHILKNHSKLIE